MNRLFRLYLLLALILIPHALHAQGPGASSLLRKPNTGREFYLSFPANWDYAAAAKYTRLYITAGVRTKVEVYVGTILKTTVYTIPNDIVTVDLTPAEAQIFTRDDRSPVSNDQVYQKKAIRIVAEENIVVYGINRITATSDGLLALPVNALGRDYIVGSAADITANGIQKLPSQFMVTAPYDNTTVTITPAMSSYGHQAGVTYTVTLNQGDVYSSMSEGSGGDLSGTYISASKPVAVTAGQNCTYLPNGNYPACDHLSEMLLPIGSWGKLYHSVPFQKRTKGDLYRIFAGEDNADVFINGVKLGTLPRRGGGAGIGFLEYLPQTRGNLEFTSNKRIMVMQYNNSQTYDNSTNTDPFYLGLLPIDQFGSDFTFTTPMADFDDNFVNMVCDSAVLPEIEIMQFNRGTPTWEKLTMKYSLTPRSFPTKVRGSTIQGFSFRIEPGTYRIRSSKPLGMYLYGFGYFDSYGYPLLAIHPNIGNGDTTGPMIEADDACNGLVSATTSDLPASLGDLRAKIGRVELDPLASTNFRLSVTGSSFIAGVSPSADFVLSVVDAARDATGVIVAVDGAGNTSLDTVTYFANGPVASAPYSGDFGRANVGTAVDRAFTLTNRSAAPVRIDSVHLLHGDRGFTIVSPKGAFTIPPSGSVEVVVRFQGAADGSQHDSLVVPSDCGLRNIATLRAVVSGVGGLIQVTEADFGIVNVGAGREGTIEIRNMATDGTTLTVTGMTGPTRPIVFSFPDGLPAFPFDLAPGTSRSLRILFSPDSIKFYRDTLHFLSSAAANPNNDNIALLQGNGDMDLSVAEAGEAATGVTAVITPNPVGGSTAVLRLRLDVRATVTVEIFDAAGERVGMPVMGRAMDPGEHVAELDLHGLPAGIYHCRITAGGRTVTKPIVLAR